MLTQIFKFELKYRFLRPANYVYFTILFLLAFAAVSTDAVQVGGAIGKVYRNSPSVINAFALAFSIIGVVFVSAIMSVPVQRDIEHGIYHFYFAFPIKKFDYLMGKFLGSFLVLFGIFMAVPLGIFIGTLMPWQEAQNIGPIMADAYVIPLVLWTIPNLFFSGVIFFSLVALTRNQLAGYVGGLVFLIAYSLFSEFAVDIDKSEWYSLLDPYGGAADSLATKYFTVAEKNSRTTPITKFIVLNRVIWLAVSLGLLVFTYLKFSFNTAMRGGGKREPKFDPAIEKLILPTVNLSYGTGIYFKQMLRQSWVEFLSVIRDRNFIAIYIAAFIFLILSALDANKIYGTSVYPVTRIMMGLGTGTYGLFLLIIFVFYAGEIIWRERILKFNLILDALPIPTWMFYGSKLLSMVFLGVVLVFIPIVVGIAIQTFKGYFDYEIGLYLFNTYAVRFPDILLTIVLCFFVQVVSNNKFAGLAVILLYYIATISLSFLDFKHPLYIYGAQTSVVYSDMNEYGHFLKGYYIFTLYWACFAIFLLILGAKLWTRGVEDKLEGKLKIVGRALKGKGVVMLILPLIPMAAIGSYIFYNTNVLQDYEPDNDKIMDGQAQYERKYRKYLMMNSPRLVAVNVKTDIYPSEHRMVAKSDLVYKNIGTRPIDSLMVSVSDEKAEDKLLKYEIAGRKLTVLFKDDSLDIVLYKMTPALAVGDSMQVNTELAYQSKYITTSGVSTQVVDNGTFFNNNLFIPKLGYNEDYELRDSKERKKRNLPAAERMRDPNDAFGLSNNYISNNGDWIRFEATLSTEPDQIAIAPGYLQKEWTENGRRYFSYKMNAPILDFYSFLSARYEVYKDKWKDVNIEIYYHKSHPYNVKTMVNAIQVSLDYYTKNFGPYQHKQVRILEFPAYATFAQSFPNTIPYSEGIGFIANVDTSDSDVIDYPFFVTAHEVAHQWWAHQVIGGNVKGSTVMSESMSEYAALMVMKQVYGKDKMRRFLQYELDDYLGARGSETEKELPLYLCENQQYLHYNKGSMVMYALQDYIGEEKLNKALSAYVAKVKFKGPPYTNSLEFLSFIEAETPDSLRYFVNDLFRKITFYNNKANEVSVKERKDKKWELTFKFETKKTYADSLGNEIPAQMNDYIDIGAFEKGKNENDLKPMYLKKHKLKAGEQSLTLVLDKKPFKAGIDPYNKLIDLNSKDNMKLIE